MGQSENLSGFDGEPRDRLRQVTEVLLPWDGGKNGRSLLAQRKSLFAPFAVAAIHRKYIGVPHLLQVIGR
jgi:hypothetical protein